MQLTKQNSQALGVRPCHKRSGALSKITRQNLDWSGLDWPDLVSFCHCGFYAPSVFWGWGQLLRKGGSLPWPWTLLTPSLLLAPWSLLLASSLPWSEGGEWPPEWCHFHGRSHPSHRGPFHLSPIGNICEAFMTNVIIFTIWLLYSPLGHSKETDSMAAATWTEK